MDTEIDARGQACPLPVVRTKAALAEIEEGAVEVQVDNETAVHNLENLAKTLKCQATSEQRGEAEYMVRIVKDASSAQPAAACAAAAGVGDGSRVVVISAATMGAGDDALGATLMKGFIFALTQLDTLPTTILLYNGGVHLTCEGSPALDDLKALAQAGVEILSCGTCLGNYKLTDKLAVGDVTNMYVIAEKQMNASLILRP